MAESLFATSFGDTVINPLRCLDQLLQCVGSSFDGGQGVLDVLSQAVIELVVECLVVPGDKGLQALKL